MPSTRRTRESRPHASPSERSTYERLQLAQHTLGTRHRHQETIRAITAELLGELDLAILLRLIPDRATELLGVHTGALHLWDPEEQILVTRAYRGYDSWRGDVPTPVWRGCGGCGRPAPEGDGPQ